MPRVPTCRRFRVRWTWLLPAIALANASVWAVALTLRGTPIPVRQVVGEFLSTTAIIVFSTNLMLVTRARPLERGFGGLDKLFASHRADGLIGAAIITLHFLVIPKSPGLLFPSKPWGYTALAWVLAIAFTASAPRMPWGRFYHPPYHQWKFVHRFNGFFVATAATHSLIAPTIVKGTPLLFGWVYGVVGVGLACYVYRELLFPLLGPFRDFRIAGAHSLPDDVTELRLEPVDGPPLARRAGQFAFLTLTGGGPSHEQHHFTISSPPDDPLRFSIKASGDWTNALAENPPPPGSSARIEGPYGCFDYRLGKKRQLWLAGGVGITPFAAMLPDVEPGYEVTLVWSVRTPDQAFYREELESAAAKHPGLSVVVHPTRELGHLRVADLEGQLPAPLAEMSALVCGPPVMRREFVSQLRALGMPKREIYTEEFTLR